MEILEHNHDWEFDQVDPSIVSKYYVMCHVLLDGAIDDEGSPDTLMILQIHTRGVMYAYELDSDEFRDSISARIPYYHYFGSLSECLTFEEMMTLRSSVLVLNVDTDLYEIRDFDDYFKLQFNIEDKP